jgi:hypothetical protein
VVPSPAPGRPLRGEECSVRFAPKPAIEANAAVARTRTWVRTRPTREGHSLHYWKSGESKSSQQVLHVFAADENRILATEYASQKVGRDAVQDGNLGSGMRPYPACE